MKDWSGKVNKLGLRVCLTFLMFIQASKLDQFSTECRKTKIKVITQANCKGYRQFIEPIRTSVSAYN